MMLTFFLAGVALIAYGLYEVVGIGAAAVFLGVVALVLSYAAYLSDEDGVVEE